eukprot:XP_025014663.1 cytochrome P450 94A1-like [Ricinus communis]
MRNLPFAKAFDNAVVICFFSRLLSLFPLVWKLKRLFNLGSKKRLKEAIGIIDKFALEIIKSKNQEKESDKSQDLLSRFMFLSSDYEFQDQEQKTKFLRDIVISFVLAGKDTISTALTWFFWLLMENPCCGRLIYQELTEVAPLEAVSESRMRIFSYDDLKRLHCLHSYIRDNETVSTYGTRVGKRWFADYLAYAIGRMEKVWGQDCSEFKPERWLEILSDLGLFI